MLKVEVIPALHRERLPHLFLNYGRLDVVDGAFVLEDINGIRVQIPVASISTIYLEPGTSMTHAAAALAAASDTQLCFVGMAGTRFYSFGRSSSGDPQKLISQVTAYADPARNLAVVHRMYELRFGEPVPSRRSLEQLRGIEGARVRETYKLLARKFGVTWTKREYDPKNWDTSDNANRALSAANACMHGLCESVIVACGYSPTLGFIHSGGLKSFVYDIADLYKFELCAPLAFKLAGLGTHDVEQAVRQQLRNVFIAKKMVNRVVRDLDGLFSEGTA